MFSQRRPLLIRNALSTMIVIAANSELTMPRPMSPSVPAASPSRAGSFDACSSSLAVMS